MPRKVPSYRTPVKSQFQLHRERWAQGCESGLCEHAKVCLARGRVPSDIVFVGEAPGESENVLGSPFVGPAGKLVDDIVRRSVGVVNRRRAEGALPPLTHSFTNLVGCIPRNESGGKAGEPTPEEIRCCMPRLQEYMQICDPRLIVCVGALARDWHDTKLKHRVDYHRPLWWPNAGFNSEQPEDSIWVIDIIHPAAILRANVAQRGLLAQKAVVTIISILEDLP